MSWRYVGACPSCGGQLKVDELSPELALFTFEPYHEETGETDCPAPGEGSDDGS